MAIPNYFSPACQMDVQEIEWTFPNLLASLHSLKSYREGLLEFAAVKQNRNKTTESEPLHFQAWLCHYHCHCLSRGPTESLRTFRTQCSFLLISAVELDPHPRSLPCSNQLWFKVGSMAVAFGQKTAGTREIMAMLAF